MKVIQRMRAGFPLICVLVAIPAVVLLNACHHGKDDGFWREESKEMKQFGQQTDKLYHTYLDGDRDQARRSLQGTIQLIEEAQLPPHGKAHTLFVTYCRLSVLEKKAGNDALAENYLLKTRYWYLRELEIDGKSVDQTSDAVKAFTGDKAQQLVQKLDNGK